MGHSCFFALSDCIAEGRSNADLNFCDGIQLTADTLNICSSQSYTALTSPSTLRYTCAGDCKSHRFTSNPLLEARMSHGVHSNLAASDEDPATYHSKCY